MNNNIIKSLRRTVLGTVAAAAVAIGFTACAEDTFMTQNGAASANGNSYKISIPANIGGGDTRAVAYNSETGGYDALFETTDYIFVYDITKDADGRKKEDDGWMRTTFLYPDANGKTTNLVGELGFSKYDDETESRVEVIPEVGDELMLYYKNTGQYIYYNNWSGETIQDYAIAKVTILSIDDNGVIKTSAATFTHPQSLYKINFTGITSGVNIKTIRIESEQQKLVCEYNPIMQWPNYFGSVKYSYTNKKDGTSQRELFFMLRFADNPNNNDKVSSSDDAITFKALGSDGHYYTGSKIVQGNLTDGKYYQAEVAMADAGLAMTLTNTTTGELVEFDNWFQISTENAAYMAENIGFDTGFEWYGGNNPLTLKNLSIFDGDANVIQVYSNNVSEESRMHYLLLDGVNTLKTNTSCPALCVYENSCLHISAKSADGRLNLPDGGLHIASNVQMTIESGEISMNGSAGLADNSTLNVEGGVLTCSGISGNNSSSCIISKSGKIRIAMDSYIQEGLIKAANGYALMVSQDGDYLVYTVTEDDGSGLAKSIVVTPATTTLYYSSSLGYIGSSNSLSAHVYPENITNKSVTWKTSDPNVVYVNEEGWVESKGIGVATVTATTNDGTNLSAQCIVTVKPAGGIKYKNEYISKSLGSQPFINPLTIEGSVTSVTYTSSDNSVATVNTSTGKVTIAAGAAVGQTVTITATATMAEDGEYSYPEWLRSSSYEISIESPAGEGQRDDYIHDSW